MKLSFTTAVSKLVILFQLYNVNSLTSIAVAAFQPFLSHSYLTKITSVPVLFSSSSPSPSPSLDVDVDYFNPSKNIDLEHAHECVEHFGKCSIQDLENMRDALHTERLQHQAANYQADFAQELDHRLLEEDLSFQLALLKDEMHTLPSSGSSPHFITNNGKPSFSPPPIMVDVSGNEDSQAPSVMIDSSNNAVSTTTTTIAMQHDDDHDHGDAASLWNTMIRQGEEMFLIPNGLSDIVAFGIALLILSLAPFFIFH